MEEVSPEKKTKQKFDFSLFFKNANLILGSILIGLALGLIVASQGAKQGVMATNPFSTTNQIVLSGTSAVNSLTAANFNNKLLFLATNQTYNSSILINPNSTYLGLTSSTSSAFYNQTQCRILGTNRVKSENNTRYLASYLTFYGNAVIEVVNIPLASGEVQYNVCCGPTLNACFAGINDTSQSK